MYPSHAPGERTIHLATRFPAGMSGVVSGVARCSACWVRGGARVGRAGSGLRIEG
jgi:hypothetical protein